jgi:hypothetical protein
MRHGFWTGPCCGSWQGETLHASPYPRVTHSQQLVMLDVREPNIGRPECNGRPTRLRCCTIPTWAFSTHTAFFLSLALSEPLSRSLPTSISLSLSLSLSLFPIWSSHSSVPRHRAVSLGTLTRNPSALPSALGWALPSVPGLTLVQQAVQRLQCEIPVDPPAPIFRQETVCCQTIA